MYRWHELDPVTFDTGLRVDVQDLGWLQEGEYLVQGSDIATTALWFIGSPPAGSDALSIRSMLVSSHPAQWYRAPGGLTMRTARLSAPEASSCCPAHPAEHY